MLSKVHACSAVFPADGKIIFASASEDLTAYLQFTWPAFSVGDSGPIKLLGSVRELHWAYVPESNYFISGCVQCSPGAK